MNVPDGCQPVCNVTISEQPTAAGFPIQIQEIDT